MTDIPNVHRHPRAIEWDAEQAECAHLFLDDKKVPRSDKQGNAYSLVGRITAYGDLCRADR